MQSRPCFRETAAFEKTNLSVTLWLKDRRREGRFEVHILLCLFTNEQVHILHVRVECGVSLAFLVPNKPSSDNDDMAAGMYGAASLARRS